MKQRLLFLFIVFAMLFLPSCRLLAWFDGETIAETNIYGVNIRFIFPHDDLMTVRNRDLSRYTGMVMYNPLERNCDVLLRRSFVDKTDVQQLRKLIAHEVGHCLDRFVLDYSHNNFANEGCYWGEYWCEPHEGFANFYAQYYTETCDSLAPFGWHDDEATCDGVPHPAQASPELMQSWVF